jgi:hypothetical protein
MALVKRDKVLSHLHRKIAPIQPVGWNGGWADCKAANRILEAFVFLLPALLIRASITVWWYQCLLPSTEGTNKLSRGSFKSLMSDTLFC